MRQEKIWTDERREYYIANVGKVKVSHFIELWGCTAASLKKNVHEWRLKGFEIPRGNKLDVGFVANHKRGEMVKTEKGWRVLNPRPKRVKKEKPPKVKKLKQIKVKPVKPKKEPVFTLPKREEKKFKDRQDKETGGKWIRINNRTVVYRKTG